MRRKLGLLAAIAAFVAIPGVAHATTFSGACNDIAGKAKFDPALKSQPAAGTYSFAGKATCTGKIDGKAASAVPVTIKVDGTGTIGCSQGQSDPNKPGQGTITVDSTGQSIPFLMSFSAVASEVNITIKGTKSGSGTGSASFFDQNNPQNNLNTVTACGGDGVKELSFTAKASVPDSTPLDDGQSAASSQAPSSDSSSNSNSNSNSTQSNSTNTASSQSTQPKPKAKPKKKHKAPKHKAHKKHKAKKKHKH
jgi:hypothetical protein